MPTIPELMTDALLVLLHAILSFVALTILLLDALSFGQLLTLAVVLRFVAQHVPSSEARLIAARTAAPIMLAYFGYRALQIGDDWPLLFLAFLRSLLAYQTIASVLVPILALAKTIATKLRDFAQDVRWNLSRMFRWIADLFRFLTALCRRRPPAPAPAPPAPPPPTKNQRMRKLAEMAQADFEAEAAVVQTLPLDDDEREVLILQAKQRLLQKLSRLPEV